MKDIDKMDCVIRTLQTTDEEELILQKVYDNWDWYIEYINEINNNFYLFSYWGNKDTYVYIEDDKIVINVDGDIYLFQI